MSRIQLALNVTDLQAAVGFYAKLFDTAPAKVRPGYANFAITDPPLGEADEDIHTYVIRKLKEQTGELADKIHTGRSRNEQVSLDIRLWLRGAIDRGTANLHALMQALLEMARRDGDAVVPGYTHVRRAQAVL